MAFEVQYKGIQIAHELEYRSYDLPKDRAWPWADIFFEVSGWVFGIAFTVEIVLRVFAYGKDFIYEAWHWFDAFIVCVWLIGKFGASFMPINANLLRLARLVRLLRLMRLIRQIETFDALFLLTTAIKGSFKILGWSCMLLSVIQMLVALAVTQLLEEYYLRDER